MDSDTPTATTIPDWMYLLASALSLLGLFIITANGFVIAFYQKKWRESVPLLYIMMATCDSITGAVVLCHAFVFVNYGSEISQLLGDKYTSYDISADFFIITVYITLQCCNRASLFYNTMLTVVRTINITRPFYYIEKRILIVFAILYPVLWVVIIIIDSLLEPHSIPNCIFAVFPGWNLIFAFGDLNVYYDYYYVLSVILFMFIPLFLPATIALVSAVIQIHSILKPSIISPSTIKERHMTVTIIILTMLCLVCNIPYTVLLVYIQFSDALTTNLTWFNLLALYYSLCTLLPFIQALLNPVFLISRGAALRQFVLEVVRGPFKRRNTRDVAVTEIEVMNNETQVPQ